MSNSILKHNDKYLKCVITTVKPDNSTSFQNAGSLVVYTDNTKDQNEIYLGTDFLASGYGLKSKEDAEQLLSNVEIIKDNIDDIENNISDIENNINDINNTLDNKVNINPILNSLDKYDLEKSDISNTCISFDGSNGNTIYIPLKKFLTNIQTAVYEKLQITNIIKSITYLPPKGDAQTVSINNNESVIDLPIGSEIKSFNINISYDAKDCGGINNVFFKYYFLDTSDNGNTIQFTNSEVKTQDPLDNSFDTDTGIGSINIYGTYANTKVFVLPINLTNNLQPIIDNVQLDIEGTSKLKNYTLSDELKDEILNINEIQNGELKLYSTENIIHDYKENINAQIKVRPKLGYYIGSITYDPGNNFQSINDLNFNLLEDNNIINTSFKLNEISERPNVYEISDDYIYIVIPKNYKIKEAQLSLDTDDDYISYNVKGYIYKYKEDYSDLINLAYKINNQWLYVKLNYDIYVLPIKELSNDILKDLNNSYNLSITLYKYSTVKEAATVSIIYDSHQNLLTPTPDLNALSNVVNNTRYFIRLHDEIFDNMHWIHGISGTAGWNTIKKYYI